jgi:hypothetical protein
MVEPDKPLVIIKGWLWLYGHGGGKSGVPHAVAAPANPASISINRKQTPQMNFFIAFTSLN